MVNARKSMTKKRRRVHTQRGGAWYHRLFGLKEPETAVAYEENNRSFLNKLLGRKQTVAPAPTALPPAPLPPSPLTVPTAPAPSPAPALPNVVEPMKEEAAKVALPPSTNSYTGGKRKTRKSRKSRKVRKGGKH